MAPRPRGGRLHVVLLAGGSGTRFWPASRRERPKQFLALDGSEPLLLRTWRRARRLAPAGRIWVVAPRHLADGVRALLPSLRAENLVVEPSPRDTAPAIALASAVVERREPGAVVAILPTDHVIRDVERFAAAVEVAAEAARGGRLVCLGIRPDRPATGFGYLRCAARPRSGAAVAVERFVEKPDRARARRFLRSGEYLWNGGMFVWRAARFLAELRERAPAVARPVERHLDGIGGAWTRATKLSVDYAVMEKASDVVVVPLDAGWDDVGSWAAAARLREESGGAPDPRHVLIDSPGTVVFGEGRTVAVVGVPGVVVVESEGGILVVGRERSEDVREVVKRLDAR